MLGAIGANLGHEAREGYQVPTTLNECTLRINSLKKQIEVLGQEMDQLSFFKFRATSGDHFGGQSAAMANSLINHLNTIMRDQQFKYGQLCRQLTQLELSQQDLQPSSSCFSGGLDGLLESFVTKVTELQNIVANYRSLPDNLVELSTNVPNKNAGTADGSNAGTADAKTRKLDKLLGVVASIHSSTSQSLSQCSTIQSNLPVLTGAEIDVIAGSTDSPPPSPRSNESTEHDNQYGNAIINGIASVFTLLNFDATDTLVSENDVRQQLSDYLSSDL